MKLKCIFGHKLGPTRDVSNIDPNKAKYNSLWSTSVLRELYDFGAPTTYYMNASCVNCGLHFSLKKTIPSDIANFLKDHYNEKQKIAIESALEYAKKEKKARK